MGLELEMTEAEIAHFHTLIDNLIEQAKLDKEQATVQSFVEEILARLLDLMGQRWDDFPSEGQIAPT